METKTLFDVGDLIFFDNGFWTVHKIIYYPNLLLERNDIFYHCILNNGNKIFNQSELEINYLNNAIELINNEFRFIEGFKNKLLECQKIIEQKIKLRDGE